MRSAILLLFVLAVPGCQPEAPAPPTKARRGGGPAAPPRPDGEDLRHITAQYCVSARQYHAEWRADKRAAAGMYQGRVVELAGTVRATGGRAGGGAFVTLEPGIECLMAEPRPWARLVPGQRVAIRGLGHWAEPTGGGLDRGVIADPGDYGAVPVLAATLAAEPEKYTSKWVVVAGEVAAVEPDPAGGVLIGLKTDRSVKVTCHVPVALRELCGAVTVGRTFRAVGEPTAGPGAVDLRAALPLP